MWSGERARRSTHADLSGERLYARCPHPNVVGAEPDACHPEFRANSKKLRPSTAACQLQVRMENCTES
jgi:hypothetical protein